MTLRKRLAGGEFLAGIPQPWAGQSHECGRERIEIKDVLISAKLLDRNGRSGI